MTLSIILEAILWASIIPIFMGLLIKFDKKDLIYSVKTTWIVTFVVFIVQVIIFTWMIYMKK